MPIYGDYSVARRQATACPYANGRYHAVRICGKPLRRRHSQLAQADDPCHWKGDERAVAAFKEIA